MFFDAPVKQRIERQLEDLVINKEHVSGFFDSGRQEPQDYSNVSSILYLIENHTMKLKVGLGN